MSDSESDNEQSSSKRKIEITQNESSKRQARVIQKKALEEDPTIFQYDEVYDDMTASREEAKKSKTTEVKKSKYVERLLATADRRKQEYERRVERQVQKERDAEGDMYKDKEVFVTATYRQKLEEMRKAEEAEQREEYLEAIGDVTKQRNLDGFYRHLYEQKMGPAKLKTEDTENNDDKQEEETNLKIKSMKEGKKRSYRRHQSNENEDESTEAGASKFDDEPTKKKVHLQSNLDADSDFSIDSESENEDEKDKTDAMERNEALTAENKVSEKTEELTNKNETTGANGSDEFVKPNAPVIQENEGDNKVEQIETPPPKPKIDIWKKRTVGEAFDEALKRYYERKQMREG